MVLLSNHRAASDALAKSRGLSGDWSVVVEGHEFLVWSSLLAAWSETFAAMASHDCLERTSRRLTVKDFSASAVDLALQFIYTGECDAEDELLVEVAAFADKYGIAPLLKECIQRCEAALTEESVFGMFAAADRMKLASVKEPCLGFITGHPKEMLPILYLLDGKLLAEVLARPELPITDFELAKLLLSWADLKDFRHDVPELFKEHVFVDVLTHQELYTLNELIAKGSDKVQSIHLQFSTYRRENGWETPDALLELKNLFGEKTFGFFINVIVPPHCHEHYPSYMDLQRRAVPDFSLLLGSPPVESEGEQEQTWMLPHHSVLLSGVFLRDNQRRPHVEVEVRLSYSPDGIQWIKAAQADKDTLRTREEYFPVHGSLPARWFRLEMVRGCFQGYFRLRGVLMGYRPEAPKV